MTPSRCDTSPPALRVLLGEVPLVPSEPHHHSYVPFVKCKGLDVSPMEVIASSQETPPKMSEGFENVAQNALLPRTDALSSCVTLQRKDFPMGPPINWA